ncbi:hypothetical protein ZYGR_0A03590 [Zygosaccharomyces rouxii]|uniref:Eukaryotic translation initiation factor 3 subunit I n=2 Tax=Zygosaccharomyces rouxii TaxID=4956 RepID=C5DQ29_ZYGRC|nr:uncharacterized protein ZYRO0A08184g [Zygosaccharomyces rouxii]KAH9198690.1 WD40-repeat-containing domain protein [Zygosaccharomyces rouxii]GAV46764.1 hypothetical protein ZYGR_0A03590 [Zygosaccharomyces rouxii]CAR25790.1 ZYRO0A08184p [Zygosaccharomyces rouxii]
MRPIMLVGHERPITQVKYNREGDLVFSCSKDNVASVWFSINGERLGTLEGHQGSIWSIDVDQYTQLCTTGSADYSVKVWNVSDGKTVHTWKSPVPVKWVEFSPCGRYVLAILDDVMKYVGSVNIYEIKRDPKTHQVLEFVEEPVARIETHEGLAAAQVAGWSSEGKYILVGHKDGSISKYDTTKNYEFCGSLPLHKGNVSDIQFSPDRSYFITSSRDSNSYIVDVDQLQVLKKYEADCPLNSACITPLKDFVILGGGQAARDVTTTAAREGKFEARFYHKIFEEEVGRVRGHFGPLNCVAVNPQGTSYTSGAEDGFVRIHHFEKSYYDFKYEVEKAAEAKEHMLAA